MENDLTKESREALIKALCYYLSTRDKRFLFLYIFYPEHVFDINLEGSPKDAAFCIYLHFKKQGVLMLRNLILRMNDSFRINLIFEDKQGIGENQVHAYKTGLKPKAKLSKIEVHSIRRSKKDVKILAEKFRVCKTTIYNVKNRKIYKYF